MIFCGHVVCNRNIRKWTKDVKVSVEHAAGLKGLSPTDGGIAVRLPTRIAEQFMKKWKYVQIPDVACLG